MRAFIPSCALAFIVGVTGANSCNPLESSCSPDPALATSIVDDFTSESSHYTATKPKGLSYTDNGLEFEISERFDNPSIKSNFYIMFGKVEVVLKAAKGQGIVSSFYLQSDDLDEIDIELIGSDPMQFQSNWFSKGLVITYDRGEYHPVSSSTLDNFHTYTVEYTKDAVTFWLDGTVVRTVLPNNGQGYPQTPMYIMAGNWAGGDPSNPPGTIEWAGGETDYSKAPFTMYIQSIVALDYSTGKTYSYGDKSGTWESIVAEDGEVNGREEQGQKEFSVLALGGAVSDSPASSSLLSLSLSSSSSSSSSSADTSVSSSSSTSASASSTSSTSTKHSSSTSDSLSTSKSLDTASIPASRSSVVAESTLVSAVSSQSSVATAPALLTSPSRPTTLSIATSSGSLTSAQSSASNLVSPSSSAGRRRMDIFSVLAAGILLLVNV